MSQAAAKNSQNKLKKDAELLPEEEIVRVMKNVFDRLPQEMSTRFSRLKDLDFCLMLRLFYSTQIRKQFVEIKQILQISTTRASMATNFLSKSEIAECCLYQD